MKVATIVIIQLVGNVKHQITLDPTVWIFDDRKISFENAFNQDQHINLEEEEIKKASLRWDREIYQQKINPPVNKSISAHEKKEILTGTYVMPIKPFLQNALPNDNATKANIVTEEGILTINFEELSNSLLLFAKEGKPLKTDGPVHLYFGNATNKNTPIKSVNKIEIV